MTTNLFKIGQKTRNLPRNTLDWLQLSTSPFFTRISLNSPSKPHHATAFLRITKGCLIPECQNRKIFISSCPAHICINILLQHLIRSSSIKCQQHEVAGKSIYSFSNAHPASLIQTKIAGFLLCLSFFPQIPSAPIVVLLYSHIIRQDTGSIQQVVVL